MTPELGAYICHSRPAAASCAAYDRPAATGAAMNILQAVRDPNLFARWFRDPVSWEAWRAFLAALFGLPMTPDQQAIWHRHTGRVDVPHGPAAEAWLICGRRAGKSFVLALIAVFLACFRDYRPYL